MTTPKLLSEEETREAFLTLGVCSGPYDYPHRCSAMHCDHCGLCDVSEEVLELISRQKQLYANEMLNELGRACEFCDDGMITVCESGSKYADSHREPCDEPIHELIERTRNNQGKG